jgi:class 3 adenylate cyclase
VASPPKGTLTFLFADIEGSTKLWEHNAPAMRLALARHDELLRWAMEDHGGYVFKTVGDAFCAAFPTGPDALECALDTQRRLLTSEWEQTRPLKVRIALHMGAVEERDGDYFGPPLNRVARLLSAAHGGQVLLSLATQELVRDQLPGGTNLRDLGEHRLKDLFRPERVFQLLAPELPVEFPPLRTLDAYCNNLPLQPLCGWKVWRRGLRHSVYVVSECNGFASEPARCGSPPRWVGSLTNDGRERHARGLLGTALPYAGNRSGSFWASPEDRGGTRCTCIDATNVYSPEHAEDQCREGRLHGVLRSSPKQGSANFGLTAISEGREESCNN